MYSTDVARMIQAPIFHVNGDDPEAVRPGRPGWPSTTGRRSSKDVVIDMVCYRRRGHNEADNPSFTQPLMYDLIDAKRSIRKLYTEALIGRGDITMEEAEQALRDYQQQLERVFTETREAAKRPTEPGAVVRPQTTGAEPDRSRAASPTAIYRGERSSGSSTPSSTCRTGFTPHPRLLPQLASAGPRWSTAGRDRLGHRRAARVRLGADRRARRSGWPARTPAAARSASGTRCSWTGTPAPSTPRCRPSTRPSSRFYVYDSLLSEFAAVGFEYGYSVARPDALVCWEAQFGDFVNGAQTIVDEFISSGEQKWGQRSGVVLLLPHGYEGQGPDHSSARIERFLRLCAQDNMTVALPTTPANYFHLLRWQALSPRSSRWSCSRRSRCCGSRRRPRRWPTFTTGSFRPVIGDPAGLDAGRGPAGAAVLRQGLLRPGRAAGQGRPHRRRDRPAGAALPAARPRSSTAELAAYPAGAELALGPGGAGQHGRLAVHGAEAARRCSAGRSQLISLPASSAPAVGSAKSTPPARGASTRRSASADAAREPGGAGSHVLHRPGHRGAGRPARRETRSRLGWLAERLREFVDLTPEAEAPVERLATWLARLDDDELTGLDLDED